jgi:type VI secretion system protein ImpA
MDINAILSPIPGGTPSGESLRYTSAYDDIQEARRADDTLDRGDWQHEVKTSDWNSVFTLTIDALTTKTKDLQIAAWLLESLVHTKGFEGLSEGLPIVSGLLSQFWESVYPEIEDDDLDFRAGPLEFINDKLWLPIKEIPLTDQINTPGFSWIKWQESRQVGFEKDILNSYGDVDDGKKRTRNNQIAEGKITAEEFDAAVKSSSRAYYESIFKHITNCSDRFTVLDHIVDEKFGRNAPRLAELKTSLEDCRDLITKIVKIKREEEPGPIPEELEKPAADNTESFASESQTRLVDPAFNHPRLPESLGNTSPIGTFHVNRILGSAGIEEAVWQDTLKKLANEGIKPALEQLLGASCSAQSIREKTNFRLLMARLCLKAGRADLARPIMEALTTLVTELQLDRWESPIWIADVLSTLYQCLTADGTSDDDQFRAREILTRLCTLDVTKAMEYLTSSANK